IATAVKRQAAPAELAEQATAIMETLNGPAAEAMLAAGVEAATDVTGFGLAGHLHNVARLSGVSAELWAERLPVLDGVRELAQAGFVPGGTRRNEAYFGPFVDVDPALGETDRTLLFDAQTSGGLLIAVDPAAEASLVADLERRGVPAAAVVGRVVDGEPGRITVRPGR
ncbi:MAG: AIR synthase-related protein, partial [Actinomycetota bacterium]